MSFLNYTYFLSLFFLFVSFSNYYIVKYNYERIFYNLYLIFFNITFFIFIYKFVVSDYSYTLVLYNTHELDFLLYKVLALWSNNEGAILLLCFIFSNLTFILNYHYFQNFRYIDNVNILKYNIIFIIVFNFINFFIFNPFGQVYWFTLEGFEFNILLQDPLFVIHPPILFAGYLGYIAFYNMAYYFNKDNLYLYSLYNNLLYKLMRFFWILLTLGILLGSWWAYYELGWEGWWSWDPVENTALMPWILATMLLHGYNIEKHNNKYSKVYTSTFSLLICLSSIMALFFVRSGFLNSVHSFVNDYTSGIWFLFFLVILLYNIYLNYYKVNLSYKNYILYYYSIYSKEGHIFIFLNIFLFLFFLIIFGTFFPVIYNILWGTDISLNVSFFNNSLKILMLPLLFVFMTNHMRIRNVIYMTSNIIYILLGIFSFSLLLLYFYFDINYLLDNVLLSLVILNIWVLIYSFLYTKNTNLSMYISHLGFFLMTFGILIFNMCKKEWHINLEPMTKIKLDNIDIIFRGFNLIKKQIYTSSYGNLILKLNNFDWFLFPEQTFSFFSGVMVTKSIVLSNFFMDFYITILEDSYSSLIHITYNYFTSLIWLGGFIIIIGPLLSLLKKSKDLNVWL